MWLGDLNSAQIFDWLSQKSDNLRHSWNPAVTQTKVQLQSDYMQVPN